MANRNAVEVNGRTYKWPSQPLVVICCDGSEPEYMEVARRKGLMPNLNAIIEKGEDLRGLSVIPSFTNPNNLSIVTGRPPAVHGISGNFFLDAETGEEVMMNDPKFLRAPTIFEGFQKAGARVAVVTAKDKLRRLLGNGLVFDGTAVSFSSEKADQATLGEHGIEKVCELVGMDVPDVYSAELSEFVFAAGVQLLKEFKPDLMYLSTTDYVQHKFAPDTEGANDFYTMMDKYLGELDAAGAAIVLTADHGMKAKTKADGTTPDVIFLQDLLDDWLGSDAAKVILPITDPYVVHHGALGSFATVYLDASVDAKALGDRIAALPGIHVVYDNERGCQEFELPRDRMGDLIVVSRDTKVLGTRETEHDLSALKEPLRSHGGITEQEIPIIVNRHTANLHQPLRNFDAFSIGLNHIAEAAQAAE